VYRTYNKNYSTFQVPFEHFFSPLFFFFLLGASVFVVCKWQQKEGAKSKPSVIMMGDRQIRAAAQHTDISATNHN
jgi:hypothetical protein